MGKRLKKFISVTTTIAFVCSISLTFAEETQDLSPPEELINGEITEGENLSEEEHINIEENKTEESIVEEEVTDNIVTEDENTTEENNNSEENINETSMNEEEITEDENLSEEEHINIEENKTEETPMLFSVRRPEGDSQQSGTVHHLDIRINKVEVDVLDQNGNHVTTYPYASITNVHSAIITKSDGTTVTVPGSYFLQSSDGGSGDPEFDATITTDNQKEKYIDLGLTYDDITSIEFIIDLKVSTDDINYESYTNLSFVMGDAELTAAKELCYNDNPNAGVHGYDFVFENPVNITVQETPESEPPEEEHESYFPTLVPGTGDVSIVNSNLYAIICTLALIINNKKYKK